MDTGQYSYLIAVIVFGYISNSCGRFYNPQFSSSMADVTVRTGESVEFQCVVKHLGRSWIAFTRVSDPPLTISWDTNIFAGTPSKYTVDRREDTWILTINNVQQSDSGTYMCQVNSVPPISQVAVLNVMVPPLINKQRSSNDTFVQEGQNATFSCSADGSPSPVYSWRRVADTHHHHHPSMIITNYPDIGSGESVIHRSNFTIFKVSRKHMANYECIASNGVEPSDSYVVKLHVQYPPQVEPVREKVYSRRGGSVRLQCKAQSWPRPTSFVWKFNGTFLHNPEKYNSAVSANSSNHDTVATLTIKNLVDRDFGNYYCWASNDERTHYKAVVELIRRNDADYNRLPEGTSSHSLDEEKVEAPPRDDHNRPPNDYRQNSPRSPNQTPKGKVVDRRDPSNDCNSVKSYSVLSIVLISLVYHRSC